MLGHPDAPSPYISHDPTAHLFVDSVSTSEVVREVLEVRVCELVVCMERA